MTRRSAEKGPHLFKKPRWTRASLAAAPATPVAAVGFSGAAPQQGNALRHFRLQAAPGIVVQFVPDGVESLPGSGGFTDDQGHFQLKCENQQDGALIGKHRAVLLGGRGDTARRNPPIPNAYTVASSTPLIVEIKPEEHNYELKIKTR